MLEWVDSEAQVGWQYVDNVRVTKLTVQSLGYLVKETDDVVVITTSISANDGCMDCLTIPKVAITKRDDIDYGKE